MKGLRIASILALVLAGCASLGPRQDRLTIQEIVDELRARGMDLVPGARTMSSRLSGSGHAFSVPGGELQIYEYRTEASATLDASTIRRTSQDVTEPPYFYQRENIIAVYNGDDSGVTTALTDVLGAQIR